MSVVFFRRYVGPVPERLTSLPQRVWKTHLIDLCFQKRTMIIPWFSTRLHFQTVHANKNVHWCLHDVSPHLPATSIRVIACRTANPSYTGTQCVTPSPESKTTPVVRPDAYRLNIALLLIAKQVFDMTKEVFVIRVSREKERRQRLRQIHTKKSIPWDKKRYTLRLFSLSHLIDAKWRI